jgi:hypothetical protein
MQIPAAHITARFKKSTLGGFISLNKGLSASTLGVPHIAEMPENKETRASGRMLQGITGF